MSSHSKEVFDNDVTLDIRLKDEYFPTGILPLDMWLRGGIRFGIVTEILGKYKSGKSDLLQYLFKRAQSLGYVTKMIEPECRFKKQRAEELGVNFEDLRVTEFKYVEKFCSYMEAYLRKIIHARKRKDNPFTGHVVMGVDSITGLTDKTESPDVSDDSENKAKMKRGDKIDGIFVPEYGKGFGAKVPKVIGEFFRREHLDLLESEALILVINQERQSMTGGKQSATGGMALQYWSCCKIEVSYFSDWYSEEGYVAELSVFWSTWSPPSKSKKIKVDVDYVKGVLPDTAIVHALDKAGKLSGKNPNKRYKFKGGPEDGITMNRFKMDKILKNEKLMQIITKDIEEVYKPK